MLLEEAQTVLGLAAGDDDAFGVLQRLPARVARRGRLGAVMEASDALYNALPVALILGRAPWPSGRPSVAFVQSAYCRHDTTMASGGAARAALTWCLAEGTRHMQEGQAFIAVALLAAIWAACAALNAPVVS